LAHSKSENLSNRTNLKTISLTYQTARLSQTEKISQTAQTQISKNLSNRENLKNQTELSKLKYYQYLKMFQVATNIGYNVPQIHAGRDLTDELPTKICISNY
jgi:hypothetical protein